MWKTIFTLAFLALLFNSEICNGKGHSFFVRERRWGIFVLAVLQVAYRGIWSASDNGEPILQLLKPLKETTFQFDLLKFKRENNQERKIIENALYLVIFSHHPVATWRVYPLGAHYRPQSGSHVQNSAMCSARAIKTKHDAKNRMFMRLWHSLDFSFNFIQSEEEV